MSYICKDCSSYFHYLFLYGKLKKNHLCKTFREVDHYFWIFSLVSLTMAREKLNLFYQRASQNGFCLARTSAITIQ